MYTFSQPALVLAIVLVLAVACSLSAPITSVISTEGGALCRRSGEIPVFRLCSCLCSYLLLLPLFVLRRHSERSEESPHFRGERSDPSAFLFPPPKHRHFDRSGSRPYVSRAAEKPASLPIPPPNPNRRLCLCSLSPTPCFPCQAPKHPNQHPINEIRVA
jgi:hypothetical protein